MKKTLLIIISLIAFLCYANAQVNELEANWLLNKVIVEGKTYEPYIIMDFNHKGIVNIKDREIASWHYKEGILILKSDIKKNYNGNFTVVQASSNEIIFENKTQSWHLSKYNVAKIEAGNIQSGFIGTWKIMNTGGTNAIKLLTFSTPDKFISVKKEKGSETRSKGKWVYDKANNSLLMIGRIDAIRGKSKIIKLDTKEFILENEQGIFSAERIAQNANKIERITFNQGMFIDDDENYIYEAHEENLPWSNSYQMMTSLKHTNQLIYNYANLIEDTKTFENKTLKADVKINEDEHILSIDFIFHGYDRYNLPDDAELPPNQLDFRFDNRIYPLKNLLFRIKGEETITTKAGTFNCILVEAFSNLFEESYKLWLIKDKPGIYAKIVADKAGIFGHYHIFELTNIK